MEIITNKMFSAERALYSRENIKVIDCVFDGPEDGESAFKECRSIQVARCFFNLRYPFWHNTGLKIVNTEMTSACRAPLWYSDNIEIEYSKLHGIKALRECSQVKIRGCNIISPEFGWSVHGFEMEDSIAESEYFMLRSNHLSFKNIRLKGKYSFQYTQNSIFDECVFDTKDAFWHAKNIVVRNSIIKGEYLGWYSENITFENCIIVGTQPLCSCKNLKLINCEMKNADLCFENSQVEAIITTPVVSIKNPLSGHIYVPEVGAIIKDSATAKGEIIIQKPVCQCDETTKTICVCA